MNVRHFMTGEPVTCAVDDTIEDASALMREHEVGCIVALREGKLGGILTDRQIAIALGAEGIDPGTPVSEVMTGNPKRVTLDDNLFQVLEAMRGASLPRRMPVVNARDELVGIVGIDDIAVIASKLNDEVFHNYTHTALETTHVPTGAKRISRILQAPSKAEPIDREILDAPITVPHTEQEHQQRST